MVHGNGVVIIESWFWNNLIQKKARDFEGFEMYLIITGRSEILEVPEIRLLQVPVIPFEYIKDLTFSDHAKCV